MEFYFLLFISVMLLSNIALVFFMGVFLVRMNDKIISMFRDLSQLLVSLEESDVAPLDNKPKTWDEKYEMEFDGILRRARGDLGLTDIPTSPSYNAPPSPAKKSDGFVVKDKTSL